MYLPNSYFDKVLGRASASYLRQTSKTVGKRKPAEAHQLEAFELFQAPRREFKLSASPLWARVTKDALRHEAALGVPSKKSDDATRVAQPGERARVRAAVRPPPPPAPDGFKARARRNAKRAAERAAAASAAGGSAEAMPQRDADGGA
jgi:hypothetical protein